MWTAQSAFFCSFWNVPDSSSFFGAAEIDSTIGMCAHFGEFIYKHEFRESGSVFHSHHQSHGALFLCDPFSSFLGRGTFIPTMRSLLQFLDRIFPSICVALFGSCHL